MLQDMWVESSLGDRDGCKQSWWDVLLVLRINGLFHPRISVDWICPLNRVKWSPTYDHDPYKKNFQPASGVEGGAL